MSIDIYTERLMPLAELGDYWPRRHGKKLHRTAGYRYATRGVRGVILEVVQLPSGLFTSLAAIQRFVAALTASRSRNHNTLQRNARKVSKQHNHVESEIERIRATIRKKQNPEEQASDQSCDKKRNGKCKCN